MKKLGLRTVLAVSLLGPGVRLGQHLGLLPGRRSRAAEERVEAAAPVPHTDTNESAGGGRE